jgi:hypothetical protein
MLVYDLSMIFGICDAFRMNWTHEIYHIVMESVYEYECNAG